MLQLISLWFYFIIAFYLLYAYIEKVDTLYWKSLFQIGVSLRLRTTCAYQGVRNVRLLENFAYVLNE